MLTTIRRPAYGSRLQDAESHDKFLLFLRAWRPREQENVVNFAGHPKTQLHVRVAVLTLPSAKESFPAMPNPKPPPSKLTGWTDALKSLYFGIVGG